MMIQFQALLQICVSLPRGSSLNSTSFLKREACKVILQHSVRKPLSSPTIHLIITPDAIFLAVAPECHRKHLP